LKKTSLPPKARVSKNVPGIIMKASDLISSNVIPETTKSQPKKIALSKKKSSTSVKES
jgi:hypothetical protein